MLKFLFQIGESGKTTKELEKTVALMKKVIDKLQSENQQLKHSTDVVTKEQFYKLQAENQTLKVRQRSQRHGHYLIITT